MLGGTGQHGAALGGGIGGTVGCWVYWRGWGVLLEGLGKTGSTAESERHSQAVLVALGVLEGLRGAHRGSWWHWEYWRD